MIPFYELFHISTIIEISCYWNDLESKFDKILETVTGWFSGKQWPDKHVICTDCFLNLVVEKSEKSLQSCSSLGSSDVAIGFSDKIDLKIMGKILQVTEFKILSFLYLVKYFYFFNFIPRVYFQTTEKEKEKCSE